jgi:hypothetical protein
VYQFGLNEQADKNQPTSNIQLPTCRLSTGWELGWSSHGAPFTIRFNPTAVAGSADPGSGPEMHFLIADSFTDSLTRFTGDEQKPIKSVATDELDCNGAEK